MASTDDVQLPDLAVIQRYSLAVRGATAPREDVIAALREDLDWLTTGTRPKPARTVRPAAASPAKPASPASPAKASSPAKAAARKAPAKKAPAKKKA